MSFASNMDAIYNDVYKCLSSNGINIKENHIYMESSSGETIVKAITEDTPPRQFSMRLSDEFIVCDDDNTLKFDMTPFKGSIKFPTLSEEELKKQREDYHDYLKELAESGEITLEELEEELKD
jgi:hypothetical protein